MEDSNQLGTVQRVQLWLTELASSKIKARIIILNNAPLLRFALT